MRMMLLAFFIFIFKISFASQFLSLNLSDTTSPKKEFKVNKKEFLEKYGTDDSSRALINYFFRRRQVGEAGVFNNGPFATLFSYIGVAIIAYGSNNNSSAINGIIDATVFTFLVLTTTFLVSSIVMWVKHSREELLKQLKNYNSGQSISKKISGTRLYKRLLGNEEKM